MGGGHVCIIYFLYKIQYFIEGTLNIIKHK